MHQSPPARWATSSRSGRRGARPSASQAATSSSSSGTPAICWARWAQPRSHRASTLRPTSTPWQLVIAEDADEYIRVRARRDAVQHRRSLNITDGILGQRTPVVVVLTTNDPATHSTSARSTWSLPCRRRVPTFEPDEKRAWLDGPSVTRSMTVLYVPRGEIHTVEQPTAVGGVGRLPLTATRHLEETP